jgi:hypothetical protein
LVWMLTVSLEMTVVLLALAPPGIVARRAVLHTGLLHLVVVAAAAAAVVRVVLALTMPAVVCLGVCSGQCSARDSTRGAR